MLYQYVEPRRLNMNFIYQIVTSGYVYTLYEEDEHAFLHVLNLRTEKFRDITKADQILDILFFDPEVTPEDYQVIEDFVSVCRHS